ncbi:MAG: hypothetical protein UW75_C0011G0017 [Parcubacteria group bacterium GW2011_GWF2_44_8]|nr:MAG: hypothetical protein UW75_C0011G0017 [Parcubacteria group bacterium GW2011_GWF2_44_8]
MRWELMGRPSNKLLSKVAHLHWFQDFASVTECLYGSVGKIPPTYAPTLTFERSIIKLV